jgi:two-component system chemotaxis response regulator CheB
VIGGSSGALEPLRRVVGMLPPRLPIAVCVAIHTSPDAAGHLDRILNQAGRWPAAYGQDGEALSAGRIYLAPPDRHLLVDAGRIRVTRGPCEHRFRPAIDPLFRTAAAAYRERVVGILLSGGRDDGVREMRAITQGGGTAVAQDPDEALVRILPESAVRDAGVDHVVVAARIAPLIVALAGRTNDRYRVRGPNPYHA